MNEYSVTVLVDASRNYTVKAESPEAAVEQAEELYSRESSTLCHQCSGKLDVGGAVGAIVYCEDKEVLDTSYQASRIAALEAECEGLRLKVMAWDDGKPYAALKAERDALAAELAAIKGQEPAGVVHFRKGGGISMLQVELNTPLHPGTKLYTLPAAPEGGGV